MTTEKTYTLVLTDAELDIIDSALMEYGYAVEDEDEAGTILEIYRKMSKAYMITE